MSSKQLSEAPKSSRNLNSYSILPTSARDRESFRAMSLSQSEAVLPSSRIITRVNSIESNTLLNFGNDTSRRSTYVGSNSRPLSGKNNEISVKLPKVSTQSTLSISSEDIKMDDLNVNLSSSIKSKSPTYSKSPKSFSQNKSPTTNLSTRNITTNPVLQFNSNSTMHSRDNSFILNVISPDDNI